MKNVNALIKVAEWLEAGAKHVEAGDHKIGGFSMEDAVTYTGECGTACCIAGAIVQFENLIDPVLAGSADFFDPFNGVGPIVKDHLDISSYQADQLFTPWEYFEYYDHIEFSDPQRAARVVRHFIETGVVDWDKFPPAPEFLDDSED